MGQNSELPPLVVIAGATASGKSAVAVATALKEGGVVVNADAMQVYADLHVLSARPSAADEAVVPHALYGVRDGAVPCSAAEWAGWARAEIERAHAGGRVPVLVGGTGLYLETLLHGIAPVPTIDPAVRAAVRAMRPGEGWAALALEDPDGAARLRATDTQRVARALEVVRSTGRPLGEWQRARVGGIAARVALRAIVVEVSADVLARRIAVRLEAMVARGALDEVVALMARGLDPALPVMKAVGVRPLAAWVRGEIERAEAIARAAAETRQYAKRQRTWFRGRAAGWARVQDAGHARTDARR